MDNDIYILLLDALKLVIGIFVFTLLSSVFAIYVVIKGYRKEKKEAVVISYDKINKGQEL